MAGNITDFLEGKILNHIFNKTAYTAPSTFYLALFTTSPTESTTGVEVSAGGYPSTRNTVTWGSVSGSSISNTNAITYTASGNWGTVLAMAVVDAATLGSGNQLWYGPLTTPRTVNNGDTFTFGIGSIIISLD